MRTAIPRSWAVVSYALAALALVTKAVGAFVPETYRDGVWAASQMRGADTVALFTLVPLLIVGTTMARQGRPRGTVLWLAGLHVLSYDVAFYLFGAVFNAWFLAYAALLAGALMLLVTALVRLDLDALGRAFDPRAPRLWPAILLALLGLGLGGLWVSQAVAYLATGTPPSSVAASGHPTAIVLAIDLTLLVPFFLWGAVGLAAGKPWGRLLATVVAASGATYTLLLAGMALRADPTVVEGARSLIPLWLGLFVMAGAVAMAGLRALPVDRASAVN